MVFETTLSRLASAAMPLEVALQPVLRGSALLIGGWVEVIRTRVTAWRANALVRALVKCAQKRTRSSSAV